MRKQAVSLPMGALACFLSVELVFLAANILKIPDGGWFPLVAGMFVFVLMTTWKRGRQLFGQASVNHGARRRAMKHSGMRWLLGRKRSQGAGIKALLTRPAHRF